MPHASVKGDAFVWYHVTRTGRDNFSFLQELFPLNDVDKEVLGVGVDISRFHDRGEWHMLVLHVPGLASAKHDLTRSTLYVLFNRKTVATISEGDDGRIAKLFRDVQKKGTHQKLHHGTTGDVVGWLLGHEFDGIDEIVDKLFTRIQQLEGRLRRPPVSFTHDVGSLRRDVLMLDLVVEPQISVMQQLLGVKEPYRGTAAVAQIVNLRDRLHGMHAVLGHYNKLIDSLFQVHETSLSHRTNQTVQLLTAISVLLMPPTLIASYYGMNLTGLPFAHDYRIVSGLIFGAVVLFLFVVHYIYRKR